LIHAPTHRHKREKPCVAIIGGGFSGVSAAVVLVKNGFTSFTIFEKSECLGGVWWDTTYPGAEVDTASLVYSFGFRPHNWTRTHASRDELLAYIKETAEEYGLTERVRLGTEVKELTWSETAHQYLLTTATGEAFSFDAVISAVGFLNVPNVPTWDGMEEFRGPVFHSAQWQGHHDLAGKRIAVIGSGSTAIQLVPALADVANEVIQFQREPGWIRPKHDRDHTADERAAWTARRATVSRYRTLLRTELPKVGGRTITPGAKANARMQQMCLDHLRSQLPGRPDLQEMVTPRHAFGSKRPVASDTYYPALMRPNVTLVPNAMVSFTAGGLVDSEGKEFLVDAVVLATGFRAADYLSTISVAGRTGRTLRDFWADEPAAYLGILVPEFPNLFLMYGPNTNGGAILPNLHNQSRFIVRLLKRLRARPGGSVEVRWSAWSAYNSMLQKRIANTALVYENNYYKSPTGRVVTNWPDSAITYGVATRLGAARPFFRVRSGSERS
jgi:cation diffusion facilitator CzcD-associated flavoprotein CzcO